MQASVSSVVCSKAIVADHRFSQHIISTTIHYSQTQHYRHNVSLKRHRASPPILPPPKPACQVPPSSPSPPLSTTIHHSPQRLPPTLTHSRTRTPRQPPIRLPLAATPSLRHPPNLRRAFAPGLHPTAHHAQPGGSEEATLALRRQGQNEVLHGAVDRAAGCDGVFSCCLEVGRWAEGGWGSGG